MAKAAEGLEMLKQMGMPSHGLPVESLSKHRREWLKAYEDVAKQSAEEAGMDELLASQLAALFCKSSTSAKSSMPAKSSKSVKSSMPAKSSKSAKLVARVESSKSAKSSMSAKPSVPAKPRQMIANQDHAYLSQAGTVFETQDATNRMLQPGSHVQVFINGQFICKGIALKKTVRDGYVNVQVVYCLSPLKHLLVPVPSLKSDGSIARLVHLGQVDPDTNSFLRHNTCCPASGLQWKPECEPGRIEAAIAKALFLLA